VWKPYIKKAWVAYLAKSCRLKVFYKRLTDMTSMLGKEVDNIILYSKISLTSSIVYAVNRKQL